MRHLVFLMIVTLISWQPAMADERTEVDDLLKGKIDIIMKLLRQTEIDKKTRNEKLLEVVTPIFDFPRMAKLSLGKKHWRAISKEKREEFSDLFITRLKESYLEKLDLYTDEDVLVEKAKQVKKRIHVVTYLVSKDDKKEMKYKFYKSKQGWKVYDVVILGVSIVQTYRSQFDGVLKKGTIDDLLQKLKTAGEFDIPTVEKTGN